jgi:hypothetical protein
MFPIVRMRVVLDSEGDVVLLYSHERIAKKKAPMMSCAAALCNGLEELLYNLWTCLMTDTGMAFCRFSFSSAALNPANRRLRPIAVFPEWSSRGSGTWFSRKACANTLRVFRIVPSAIDETPPDRLLVGPASRMDWAKRMKISDRWCCANDSRNGSVDRPMDARKSVHRVHVLSPSFLYLDVVAAALVIDEVDWR